MSQSNNWFDPITTTTTYNDPFHTLFMKPSIDNILDDYAEIVTSAAIKNLPAYISKINPSISDVERENAVNTFINKRVMKNLTKTLREKVSKRRINEKLSISNMKSYLRDSIKELKKEYGISQNRKYLSRDDANHESVNKQLKKCTMK